MVLCCIFGLYEVDLYMSISYLNAMIYFLLRVYFCNVGIYCLIFVCEVKVVGKSLNWFENTILYVNVSITASVN